MEKKKMITTQIIFDKKDMDILHQAKNIILKGLKFGEEEENSNVEYIFYNHDEDDINEFLSYFKAKIDELMDEI